MCGQPDGSSLMNLKVAEIPLAFQSACRLKDYDYSDWSSPTQAKLVHTSDIITITQVQLDCLGLFLGLFSFSSFFEILESWENK